MRVTIRLLGLDLLDVELSTDPSSPGPDDDTARDMSGGTLAATPMGFVAHMDRPHEVDTPDRDW